MYVFYMLNLKTNKTFYQTFDSQYHARLYRNKCRHSKKVRILSYTGDLDC